LPDADVAAAADPLPRPAALGGARFRAAAEGEAPGRTYGGRIVAQALAAAAQTVDPAFAPHSAHAQFLRGGDMRRPTDYVVETLRDGRTVAARAVRVSQDDRLLTVVLVSFARERPGLAHQPAMPDVPAPEMLADHAVHRGWLHASDPLLEQALWRREHPFEFRPVDFPAVAADRPGPLTYWFRARPEIDSSTPAARAALVAYVSDRFVMTASLMPHLSRLAESEFSVASLDHAIWIHRDHAPGDWLLYRVEGTTLAGSRAFTRGEMFDAAGRHIASVGQEGVLTTRPRRPGSSDES
jgi:acyl-CoA thioesterase-2